MDTALDMLREEADLVATQLDPAAYREHAAKGIKVEVAPFFYDQGNNSMPLPRQSLSEADGLTVTWTGSSKLRPPEWCVSTDFPFDVEAARQRLQQ